MIKKLLIYFLMAIFFAICSFLIAREIEYGVFAIEKKEEYNSMLKNVDEINKEYDTVINELDTIINTEEKNIKIESLNNEIANLKEQISNIKTENVILENKKNSLSNQYLVLKKQKEAERSHLINGVITYNQYPNYPTGCESVALYILLKYYNIDVTVNDIINILPKGDLPYYENEILYGGNPYLEFIGNPTSNSSYGVYDVPIKTVANSYKEGIISGVGTSLNDVLKIVKQDRPVLVWTTSNLSLPFISRTWIYKPTSETISWISGEHAVVIVGYNDDKIIISDPINGKIVYQNRSVFESRYNYMGKRALYY